MFDIIIENSKLIDMSKTHMLNLFQQDFVPVESVCTQEGHSVDNPCLCLNLSCLIHGDSLDKIYEILRKQKPPE